MPSDQEGAGLESPARRLWVLLVEDAHTDAVLIQALLDEAPEADFAVTHVRTLADALELLALRAFDVVLLDLTLPDSEGIATFDNTIHHAPDVPIVVVTGSEGPNLDLVALEHGAQEFLTKEELRQGRLARSILYSIERHRRFRTRALHDSLTGLPNRELLTDRLTHVLARVPRQGRQAGVVFLDLDGFKAVNDRFGHPFGDLVLAAVAARLRASLRPSDTLARVGGDEFVAVVEDLAGAGQAVAAARRLVDSLAEDLDVDGRIRVGVSAGVAVSPPWSEGADWDASRLGARLVVAADQAMYKAKRAGGGVSPVETLAG